ncbi:helix-turn-helix domain-containing protein [Nocardioides sp.]|uniref:helix-turn-helix domain-containing protein n=1 Tax=Nocardioides sp. TaxID=35761 RepID=UPI003D0E3D4E
MAQHELDAGTGPAGSLDEGGRLLAATVLAAAGRGDRSAIAELTAPLDVDQLRSLVATLAVQVDQVMTAEAVSGPAAVCELAINASAPLFGVTPEDIRSPQRSRPISDARAVAMTAARENGLSLPAIAEQFGKDHGSVIHAVRRTQQRPRLADAAARVTQHVNDRYTERLLRPDAAAPAGAVQAAAAAVPVSTFEPHDLVDHAVVAAAQAFATTPETLIGADRTRSAADARGVAMTAARMRGQSLPQIARHFDRDHTTVLHATRRIEKSPPLRDLAAKIAGELAEEPAEAGRSTRATAGQGPVGAGPDEPAGPRSPGAQHERRETPAGTTERHLQVAR